MDKQYTLFTNFNSMKQLREEDEGEGLRGEELMHAFNNANNSRSGTGLWTLSVGVLLMASVAAVSGIFTDKNSKSNGKKDTIPRIERVKMLSEEIRFEQINK